MLFSNTNYQDKGLKSKICLICKICEKKFLTLAKKYNARRISGIRPQKTTFALNKLKNLNNLSLIALLNFRQYHFQQMHFIQKQLCFVICFCKIIQTKKENYPVLSFIINQFYIKNQRFH